MIFFQSMLVLFAVRAFAAQELFGEDNQQIPDMSVQNGNTEFKNMDYNFYQDYDYYDQDEYQPYKNSDDDQQLYYGDYDQDIYEFYNKYGFDDYEYDYYENGFENYEDYFSKFNLEEQLDTGDIYWNDLLPKLSNQKYDYDIDYKVNQLKDLPNKENKEFSSNSEFENNRYHNFVFDDNYSIDGEDFFVLEKRSYLNMDEQLIQNFIQEDMFSQLQEKDLTDDLYKIFKETNQNLFGWEAFDYTIADYPSKENNVEKQTIQQDQANNEINNQFNDDAENRENLEQKQLIQTVNKMIQDAVKQLEQMKKEEENLVEYTVVNINLQKEFLYLIFLSVTFLCVVIIYLCRPTYEIDSNLEQENLKNKPKNKNVLVEEEDEDKQLLVRRKASDLPA